MGILLLVLPTIATVLILKVINRKTIGTTRAYFVRAVVVWIICFVVISAIVGNIIK